MSSTAIFDQLVKLFGVLCLAMTLYFVAVDFRTQGIEPALASFIGIASVLALTGSTKASQSHSKDNPHTRQFDCFECGKKNIHLRCDTCKSAWYCSQECQILAWPQHRKSCKSFETVMKQRESLIAQTHALAEAINDKAKVKATKNDEAVHS